MKFLTSTICCLALVAMVFMPASAEARLGYGFRGGPVRGYGPGPSGARAAARHGIDPALRGAYGGRWWGTPHVGVLPAPGLPGGVYGGYWGGRYGAGWRGYGRGWAGYGLGYAAALPAYSAAYYAAPYPVTYEVPVPVAAPVSTTYSSYYSGPAYGPPAYNASYADPAPCQCNQAPQATFRSSISAQCFGGIPLWDQNGNRVQ